MQAMRMRLRPEVQISVDYEDHTEFGSPVNCGRRAEASIAELYSSVIQAARAHGLRELHGRAPELLVEVVNSQAFARIAEVNEAGYWTLKPEVLFPDAGLAKPRTITLLNQESGRLVRAGLPAGHWPLVHDLIARLSSRAGIEASAGGLARDMQAILGALVREELVEPGGHSPDFDSVQDMVDFTFVGHNTVVVRSATTRIMVDPLLFPTGSRFPASYQPLQVRHLEPIHAVLITHSHPDHFDPASLLQFPPETRIIVPSIERENLLSVAMGLRLRELGFHNISLLSWAESIMVGDIEVHALPLYGEQPTDGDVLHPDVRNAGNTYLLRTPDFSAVFLADSGRDLQGDVRTLATETRRRLGPVDVVFSGYRGWHTYPVQLLFSSVARYLLFVPPWLWNSRLQLMTTIDEAVDVAERWGARLLVPYADGGAPWHWDSGLGPNLCEPASEVSWLDPFPQRVAAAAAQRIQMPDKSCISSPVKVVLLHPGESIVETRGDVKKLAASCCIWPYAERDQQLVH